MSSTTSDPSRPTTDAPKLYSRRGDGGRTLLADGTSVDKRDSRIEACGTLDELCSHVGLLAALLPREERADLHEVQRRLFALSALAAGVERPRLLPDEATVRRLERLIDATESAGAGRFGGFVLPGGCREAAQANVCRAVCRRTERRLSAIGTTWTQQPAAQAYINRLSDYFYALARKLNKFHAEEEIIL